jgi:2'-5' RNA ligase
MRLFLSVDLPPGLAGAVETLQERFSAAEGLRFTDPTQAHVTLKFLGEVDPDRVDEVETAVSEAVTAADIAPFRATVGGLGAFPSPEYISVVWVGLEEGGEQLTRLHGALEAATTEMGFEPEQHEFTPHVTIARMDDARGKDLVQRRLREDDPTVGSFDVGEVRLTESTLTESGPTYETVARFPL